MSSSTGLLNTRVSTNHQQLQTDLESQRRVTDFTENTILAIAEVDRDFEEERAIADAANLAHLKAQNNLIQRLYQDNSQLKTEIDDAKMQGKKSAIKNSQEIVNKDEMIQSLMAKVAEQEIRLKKEQDECNRLQEEQEQARQSEERAHNARIEAEQARQRAHREHLARIIADGF